MGDPPGDQEPPRVPRRIARSFLILHGLEGSGPDHWQTWLWSRLLDREERVLYPSLPDPFDPQPDEWLEVLRTKLLPRMRGERIVICHSLACLLWLRHARDDGEPADRVLLVAPPYVNDVPAVVRFLPTGVSAEHVRAAAKTTRMICSDEDPYCPAGAARIYGDPLELDYRVIPGAGHLNTEAGYGPWPDVESWSLDH